MDLSGKQLKLLKKACRKVVRCDKKSKGEIVDFLSKKNVIDFTIENTENGVFYWVKANQDGKAIVYEKFSVKRRANIALVVSIIAIVISALTAFTPFPEWSKALMQSLFSQSAR